MYTCISLLGLFLLILLELSSVGDNLKQLGKQLLFFSLSLF